MCTVSAVRAQAIARYLYASARIARLAAAYEGGFRDPLSGRARTSGENCGLEEHWPAAGSNAGQVLPALRASIKADMAGACRTGNRHPVAARVGRRANMLFDEIRCEPSQGGVRVHGFPGFSRQGRGKLRTLNYRSTIAVLALLISCCVANAVFFRGNDSEVTARRLLRLRDISGTRALKVQPALDHFRP